jgi:CRISPR-associated exonuclease Cas4
MPTYLVILIALAVFLLGICLFWLSRRKWKQMGLPPGRLIYADPGLWGRPEKPFYDSGSGLTGKPDYVVKQKGRLLPVEVKSAWAPAVPHDSHILQLGAYCLLIEKASGKRPPYGILKYRNRTFAIDYTKSLEDSVLEIIEKIRKQKNRSQASRSHDEPRRCAHCGYRKVCDQRL